MRDVLGPFAVAGLALALRLYFIAYESRIEPIFDAAIYWQQGQTMRA